MNRRPAAIAVRSTLLLPAAVLLLAMAAPAEAQDNKPPVAFAASPPGLTPAADTNSATPDTTSSTDTTSPTDSVPQADTASQPDSASLADTTSPATSNPTAGSNSAADTASPADATSPGNTPDSTGAIPAPYYYRTGDEPSQPAIPDLGGLNGVRSLPPNSFSDQPQGIPYSNVLNTDGVDLNQLTTLNGTPLRTNIDNPAKLGNAEGSFNFQTGNVGLNNGLFQSAGEPSDADIKAGPFFIKFHYLDGLVLYADNAGRTEVERHRELLVLLTLNLSIIAQISDNLQFALYGSIEYLPLQNQLGYTTSAFDELGLLLYATPLFLGDLSYNTDIASWPVRFDDVVRIGTGRYSTGVQDNFDLFHSDLPTRDENGDYTFHYSPTRNSNSEYNGTNQDITNEVVYLSNVISAYTEHDLPSDVKFTAQVTHQNLWYNQSNRGLPPARDDFDATLIQQRPEARFTPYLSYGAYYTEGISDSITQTLVAGFFGPLDDQISMSASAGAYFDAFDHDGYLFSLSLVHAAGPYTNEQLTINRSLSTFDQEQQTTEYYNISQVIGPTLQSTLFLAHTSYENLTSDGNADHSSYIGGLELTSNLGPKTTLNLAGIFDQDRYTDGETADTTTGRVTLSRIMTDTLTFQLFYQYQHSTDNRPDTSFIDNIVYFRFVKLL